MKRDRGYVMTACRSGSLSLRTSPLMQMVFQDAILAHPRLTSRNRSASAEVHAWPMACGTLARESGKVGFAGKLRQPLSHEISGGSGNGQHRRALACRRAW